MKTITMKVLALAALSTILLVGCSNPEKMKDVPQEALPTATPNPMVLKGNTVVGKISGQFPPKYFNKKATIEATPVLVYGDAELKLDQFKKVYQGEDVTENKGAVVSYDQGGPYSLEYSFPYEEAMMRSDLELRFVLMYKDKVVPFDEGFKLVPGINVTQNLVDNAAAQPALMPHGFEKDAKVQQTADIYFNIQKSDLRSGELNKAEVKALQKVLKELPKDTKTKLQTIEVKAYASPDGPAKLNEDLSAGRANTTEKWAAKTAKAAKQDASAVKVTENATDWEGFKQMVENSNIEDKEMILRVLEMYSDPETRNREMHNLGKVFQVIAEDILPKLRRSQIQVNMVREGKSDEEIKALVANDKVGDLTLGEGLYAATLETEYAQKAKIYENLASRFEDVRVYNNLAYVYLSQDRTDEAVSQLDKAAALEAENPYVLCNQGVVALRKGNIEEAERLLNRAAGAGDVVKAALAVCAINRGNYEQALTLAPAQSFNLGLANLLLNNLDAAKNIFTAEQSAKAYYGLAIIGARNGDEKAVVDNLTQAVRMDGKLKERAVKDIEFAKFLMSEAVAAIIK